MLYKQGLTLSTVRLSGTSDIDSCTSVQLLFRLTSGIIRRIIRRVIMGPVRSPLWVLGGDPHPTQAMKIWEPIARQSSSFPS